MSSKQKVLGGIVGITILLLIGGLVYSWASDSSIRKVASLQEQLLNADDLSKEEFNALKLNLMRTVDTMPRSKVREMYEAIGTQRREAEKKNVEDFFAANEIQKSMLLDRVIDQKQRSREIQRAMRTDMAWTRRKPTKEDEERMAAAKKIKEAMDAGKLTEEQAREKFMALRGDRGNDRNRRPELSDEERAEREEQRRLKDEFDQALLARAEEIGVELPAERGRGRGRGQNGGRAGGGRGGPGGGQGRPNIEGRGRTQGTQS